MVRLKSRQRPIPGGLRFRIAELRWTPPPYASFDTIVNGVIAARLGNPSLAKRHNWATDRATVEAEVDNFNALFCVKMNWIDYVDGYEGGGGAPSAPFPHSPKPGLMKRLAHVASGAAVVVEFIAKDEAVAPELANARAAVCAACPLNEKGDWLSTFTVPVSNAIRQRLNERKSMKLSTPLDDQLGVCGACSCPLPLKIHFPIARIVSRLPAESKAALDKGCWITSESK